LLQPQGAICAGYRSADHGYHPLALIDAGTGRDFLFDYKFFSVIISSTGLLLLHELDILLLMHILRG
jgi:hypothetical protein